MEKRKTILRILYRLTILFLLPMVAGCDSASRELHEALNLAGDWNVPFRLTTTLP